MNGTSSMTFIYAAYGVAWGMILGYMWRLHRKGARADAEFESSMRSVREERGA